MWQNSLFRWREMKFRFILFTMRNTGMSPKWTKRPKYVVRIVAVTNQPETVHVIYTKK